MQISIFPVGVGNLMILHLEGVHILLLMRIVETAVFNVPLFPDFT